MASRGTSPAANDAPSPLRVACTSAQRNATGESAPSARCCQAKSTCARAARRPLLCLCLVDASHARIPSPRALRCAARRWCAVTRVRSLATVARAAPAQQQSTFPAAVAPRHALFHAPKQFPAMCCATECAGPRRTVDGTHVVSVAAPQTSARTTRQGIISVLYHVVILWGAASTSVSCFVILARVLRAPTCRWSRSRAGAGLQSLSHPFPAECRHPSA